MLCEAVGRTRSLGKPNEWLHRGMRWPAGFPPHGTIEERCRLVLLKGVSANGVAGVKLFSIQFDEVRSKIDFGDWFPNVTWVWLRRRDLLRQAISLALASEMNRWTSEAPTRPNPVYSSSKVRTALALIVRNERLWAGYFAAGGITPPVFWYEDIVDRLRDTVSAIGAHMAIGLSRPPDTGNLHMQRQSGHTNDEWVERFRSEHGSEEILSRLAELRDVPLAEPAARA
jgi:LPS sulfotransferase NodH